MTARAVGLALAGGRGVYAWWPSASAGADAARTIEFAFDAAALAAGDDTVLLPALTALRRFAAAQTLHVALATPWASPRLVSLPPIREREARAVLARDAARYFPAPRTESVVTVRALARDAWLACDADGVVLDAVARAAQTAGYAMVRFLPAAASWAHTGANAAERAFVLDDEATVISSRRGMIAALRRCRVADLASGLAHGEDALALAARHAPAASEPELVSARERAARDRRARRSVRHLLLTGTVLFVAGFAMQGVGTAQRVSRLEARRNALRPAVAPLVALRDSLTQAAEALDVLARARADAPSWGARLLTLAAALPRDAYFTSVRADADSAIVEGRAVDAARLLARLKAAQGVRSVRATSETIAGDGTAEFAAVVHFAARGAP